MDDDDHEYFGYGDLLKITDTATSTETYDWGILLGDIVEKAHPMFNRKLGPVPLDNPLNRKLYPNRVAWEGYLLPRKNCREDEKGEEVKDSKYDHLFKVYNESWKNKFVNKNYSPPKWIQFCDFLTEKGLEVKVYQSKKSVSKYIKFKTDKHELKVRFSQHAPRYFDFDVNVGPNGLTYKQLIKLLEINI